MKLSFHIPSPKTFGEESSKNCPPPPRMRNLQRFRMRNLHRFRNGAENRNSRPWEIEKTKERLGWKTRYRVGCSWRSYQVFHNCLVVYFARKTKMQMLNHSIMLNCLGTLLHLRVPPAPMGDWGYRGRSSPAGRWKVLEESGPGRQSTCQLAFPGCFFNT